MAWDGECMYDLFYLIGDDPTKTASVLPTPACTTRECCADHNLNVFADVATSDPFKNDKNGFLYKFPDAISAVVLTLQLNGIDKTILTDNTYGTLYPYGFFVNSKHEKYIGFQMDWKAVLTAYGPGVYNLKTTFTSSIGTPAPLFSDNFNLQQFTPERANKTVKIEYYLNNIIGDNKDDKLYREFGALNWYNAIRINGFFGNNTSTYTLDLIKYTNGQKLWVNSEQEPEFVLKTKLLPAFVLDLIRTDILMADTILITDYNSNNPNVHIQRDVKRNSDFSPKWNAHSKLASVEVKFIQGYNNLKRRRC